MLNRLNVKWHCEENSDLTDFSVLPVLLCRILFWSVKLYSDGPGEKNKLLVHWKQHPPTFSPYTLSPPLYFLQFHIATLAKRTRIAAIKWTFLLLYQGMCSLPYICFLHPHFLPAEACSLLVFRDDVCPVLSESSGFPLGLFVAPQPHLRLL